jgi:hypothetical protein
MRHLAYFTLATISFAASAAGAVDRVESLNESCLVIEKRIKTEGELIVRYPSSVSATNGPRHL